MNKWIVDSTNQGHRLLSFVKNQLDSVSTKDIRWAIEHHRCLVNGRIERFCSCKMHLGDRVEIEIASRPSFQLESSRILREEKLFLFYNKPAGIPSDELASRLKLHLVHRLDRDTTGVLILAKNSSAQKQLEHYFRERKIVKKYLALVKGVPSKKSGIIENYIGKLGEKEGEGRWGIVSRQKGMIAKTEWEVEKFYKNFSLLLCKPITGRTHQLRIHLQSLGVPIVGDIRYGTRAVDSAFYSSRPLLHALSIELSSLDSEEKILVQAPVPEDFDLFLKKLESEAK